MIKKEFYRTREDGVNLYKNYSDTHHYILQHPTEMIYEEAIDVEDAPYTYEETEDVIPEESETMM